MWPQPVGITARGRSVRVDPHPARRDRAAAGRARVARDRAAPVPRAGRRGASADRFQPPPVRIVAARGQSRCQPPGHVGAADHGPPGGAVGGPFRGRIPVVQSRPAGGASAIRTPFTRSPVPGDWPIASHTLCGAGASPALAPTVPPGRAGGAAPLGERIRGQGAATPGRARGCMGCTRPDVRRALRSPTGAAVAPADAPAADLDEAGQARLRARLANAAAGRAPRRARGDGRRAAEDPGASRRVSVRLRIRRRKSATGIAAGFTR